MSRETRGKQLDYLSEKRWFIHDGRENFVKLIWLSQDPFPQK